MDEEVLIVGQDPRSTDLESEVATDPNGGSLRTPGEGIEMVLVFGLLVAGHRWCIRALRAWIR